MQFAESRTALMRKLTSKILQRILRARLAPEHTASYSQGRKVVRRRAHGASMRPLKIEMSFSGLPVCSSGSS